MTRTERGSITILSLAMVVLAMVVAVGVARAGRAAGEAARADTAADAAALAAADMLAMSRGESTARSAAARVAAENDGVIRRCDCVGDHAEVLVQVGEALGSARAEVRRRCQFGGVACG